MRAVDRGEEGMEMIYTDLNRFTQTIQISNFQSNF